MSSPHLWTERAALKEEKAKRQREREERNERIRRFAAANVGLPLVDIARALNLGRGTVEGVLHGRKPRKRTS